MPPRGHCFGGVGNGVELIGDLANFRSKGTFPAARIIADAADIVVATVYNLIDERDELVAALADVYFSKHAVHETIPIASGHDLAL